MSKQLKTMVTESLRRRFDGVEEACVVDMTGVNVAQAMKIRRMLSARNMRVVVVKNSLARRAFEGGPLDVIGKNLSGPCALVTGGDSAIEVAREMVSLAKEFTALTLKEGLLTGIPELVPVTELAAMKGQAELVGEIAMLLASPGRALAGCLGSPQSRIAGCLKTMAEAEGEGEAEES